VKTRVFLRVYILYVCNSYYKDLADQPMTTFSTRTNKDLKKVPNYFSMMRSELDLDKYKLAKYQELFKLASFQNMHDADLAYYNVYKKCAENAGTKESLIYFLEQEEKLFANHRDAFNPDVYNMHTLKAISEIKHQLKNGVLDHLYA
jgi:hypothetical protein